MRGFLKAAVLFLFLPALLFAAPFFPGQKILVGFEGTTPADPEVRAVIQYIRQKKIGGVVLFSRNIENPEQLKTLTDDLIAAADFPLLIAVDQEGGEVQRLSAKNGFDDYPAAQTAAQTLSPKEAYTLYFAMAQTLKKFQIHLNLAPCVDLALSPAFARRSFSSNPTIVERYARQFILAHEAAGVLSALKHYPGHGSTSADTHLMRADITGSFSPTEEEPFLKLSRQGVARIIMTGHLWNTRMDAIYPASLSLAHVQRLRKKGFKGVLMTDDLLMGALKGFLLEERMLRAVLSGHDLLLFGKLTHEGKPIPETFHREIHAHLKQKKISLKELQHSHGRVEEVLKTLP